MSVPGPVLGPCSSWIDGDAVAACCAAPPEGSGAEVFDDAALQASMLAFELSGRQFTGLCDATVRPCRGSCSCFVPGRSAGAYSWTTFGSQGFWLNEDCSSRCGCGGESYVKLAGYPVREITEVKIDGDIVDPSGYELIEWRRLLRLAEPGPPVVHHSWPGCQDLSLDDDQPGTFSITYRYGVDPPQLGLTAAAALACELYKACASASGACALPTKVTKVVRQGVTVENVASIATMLRSGSSGIPLLDAFIAGYNPTKMKRRPAIWSPDVAPYPQRRQ